MRTEKYYLNGKPYDGRITLHFLYLSERVVENGKVIVKRFYRSK